MRWDLNNHIRKILKDREGCSPIKHTRNLSVKVDVKERVLEEFLDQLGILWIQVDYRKVLGRWISD